MKVKIIGYGWVGKAMHTLFPDALLHDPELGHVCKETADVTFICVPTPSINNTVLDCSIVHEVVKECKEQLIVIRSTVMPGTCKQLEDETGKDIVFQPEYLGETVAHPMTDQHNRPFMILGGKPSARQKVIELYQQVFNANITIRQVDNYTAEVIKLTENRAIAYKIAQCQELYDACRLSNVDYNEVREAVYGDDPRFNLYWTFVYPEKRGFNSKCLPKDVYAWAAWAESVGIKPSLTQYLLQFNEGYLFVEELNAINRNT